MKESILHPDLQFITPKPLLNLCSPKTINYIWNLGLLLIQIFTTLTSNSIVHIMYNINGNWPVQLIPTNGANLFLLACYTHYAYNHPKMTFLIFADKLVRYRVPLTEFSKQQLIELIIIFWPVFGPRYKVSDLHHITIPQLKDLLGGIAKQHYLDNETFFNYYLTTKNVVIINEIAWVA